MDFASFELEILSSITDCLDGFEICRLWHIGSRKLIYRLENGGVTRFELALAQTVNRKWPKFVSRLRCLNYLSIRCLSNNHRVWFSDIDLAGLAPTLRHLELDFDHFEFALLGLPFVRPDKHPDPIWSPDTDGKMELNPFEMAKHLPNLETLVISRDLMAPHVLVPLLPKSLLKLSLPYQSFPDELFDQLPPNLTHLGLPQLQEIGNSVFFPSNLTHLDLRSLSEISKTVVTRFPPSLTSLNLHNCNSGHIDLLPSTMVHLDLTSAKETRKAPFNRLFPNLRHVIAFLEGKLTNPGILPSCLQTLQVWKLNIKDDEACMLPRTLTDLTVLESTHLTPACLLNLPPKLRILWLEIDFPANSSSYPFVPYLEKLTVEHVELASLKGATKLRTIRATGFSYSDLIEWAYISSVRRIESYLTEIFDHAADLEHLPPQLSTLVFRNPLSPLSLVNLPRTLQYLDIVSPHALDEVFLTNLPPTLTILKAEMMIRSRSYHFKAYDEESDFGSDKEESLEGEEGHSRNRLTERRSDKPFLWPNLNSRVIAQLPRSLERLSLDPADTINDDVILHLPPRLSELTLTPKSGGTLQLTDACIPHLPRRLTSLNLACPLITNEAIKHLPRTLTHVNIGRGAQLNLEKCFADLPPFVDWFGDMPVPTSRDDTIANLTGIQGRSDQDE